MYWGHLGLGQGELGLGGAGVVIGGVVRERMM